ncbi:MAG: hypothetical protein CNLJKLNK_00383 [Holosporales bacterium]
MLMVVSDLLNVPVHAAQSTIMGNGDIRESNPDRLLDYFMECTKEQLIPKEFEQDQQAGFEYFQNILGLDLEKDIRKQSLIMYGELKRAGTLNIDANLKKMLLRAIVNYEAAKILIGRCGFEKDMVDSFVKEGSKGNPEWLFFLDFKKANVKSKKYKANYDKIAAIKNWQMAIKLLSPSEEAKADTPQKNDAAPVAALKTDEGVAGSPKREGVAIQDWVTQTSALHFDPIPDVPSASVSPIRAIIEKTTQEFLRVSEPRQEASVAPSDDQNASSVQDTRLVDFANQIKELTDALAAREALINDLREKIKQSEAAFEEKIRGLNGATEEEKNELTRVKSILAAQEQSFLEQSAKLQTAEETSKTLNAALQDKNQQAVALLEQIQRHEQEKENQLKAHTTRIEEFQASVLQASTKIDELKSIVVERETLITELNTRIQQMQGAHEEQAQTLNTRIAEQGAEVLTLTRLLKDKNAAFEKLSKEHNAQQERLTMVLDSLDGYVREEQRLKAELDSKIKEVNAQEEVIKEKTTELLAGKETIDTLNRTLADKNQEGVELIEKVRNLEVEKDQLLNNNTQTQEKLTQSSQLIDHLTAESVALKSKLESAEQTIKEIASSANLQETGTLIQQRTIDSLEEQMRLKVDEVAALEKRIQDREKEKASLIDEKNALTSRIQTVIQEAESYKTRTEARIKSAVSENESLNQVKNKMQAKVEELMRELGRATTALQAKDEQESKNQTLTTQILSRYKSEIDDLKSRLQDAQQGGEYSDLVREQAEEIASLKTAIHQLQDDLRIEQMRANQAQRVNDEARPFNNFGGDMNALLEENRNLKEKISMILKRSK